MRVLAIVLCLALTAVPARAGLGMMGVSAASNQVAREAVTELKSGDVSASGLSDAVVSREGATNLAFSVAQAAVVELVPGGRLVRAGAGIALGAGVADARGRPFSLGRALAGTAGGLVGSALLAPLPGGAIIGGIAGAIAGEEIYTALKSKRAF